jgi:fructosamine-3-kinase
MEELLVSLFDGISDYKEIYTGSNDSFRVISSEEKDYFVKFGSESGERILSEAAIMRELETKIPVPIIHDSGFVSDFPYLVAEWVDGSPLCSSIWMDDENMAKKLGEILGKIHTNFREDEFGLVKSSDGENIYIDSKSLDWYDFYLGWIHQKTDNLMKYSDVGSDIRRLAHWERIQHEGDYVLSPLDLHYGNLLVKDDLEAVVDLERCLFAPPEFSYEITRNFTSPNEDYFDRGYNSYNSLDRKPIYKLSSLSLEVNMSHMLDNCYRDYYEVVDEVEEELK